VLLAWFVQAIPIYVSLDALEGDTDSFVLYEAMNNSKCIPYSWPLRGEHRCLEVSIGGTARVPSFNFPQTFVRVPSGGVMRGRSIGCSSGTRSSLVDDGKARTTPLLRMPRRWGWG